MQIYLTQFDGVQFKIICSFYTFTLKFKLINRNEDSVIG